MGLPSCLFVRRFQTHQNPKPYIAVITSLSAWFLGDQRSGGSVYGLEALYILSAIPFLATFLSHFTFYCLNHKNSIFRRLASTIWRRML